MSRKVSLAMLIVLLVSLVVIPASASNPGEPPLPKPPVPWPGMPTAGPLTPEEIKKLPAPPKDTSALEEFKAELGKLDVDAAAKGLKVETVPTDKLEVGVALQESLTDEQRQAIGEAFARHEKALRTLIAPAEAEMKPEGLPSLEAVRELEERLEAWQAALDADIKKVLTEEQFAQYLASRPTVPELDVSGTLLP